ITPGTFHEQPQMKRMRCGASSPATGSPFSASDHKGWVRVRTSIDGGSGAGASGAGTSAVGAVSAPSAASSPSASPANKLSTGARTTAAAGASTPEPDWAASTSTSNSNLSSYSVTPPPVATSG